MNVAKKFQRRMFVGFMLWLVLSIIIAVSGLAMYHTNMMELLIAVVDLAMLVVYWVWLDNESSKYKSRKGEYADE